MEATVALGEKILGVVDVGLCAGLGNPTPGEMCVEAAICFALGEPHGDRPSCVAAPDRKFKVTLNDARWSSNAQRAKGMRLLAIAELGTVGMDRRAWVDVLARETIRRIVPMALRAAAKRIPAHAASLEEAAVRCARDANRAAALEAQKAVRAAAAATDAAAAYADAAVDAAVAAAYADAVAAVAAVDAAAAAAYADAAAAAAYADAAAAVAYADAAVDAAAYAAYADAAADAAAYAAADAVAYAYAAADAAAARDLVLQESAACALDAYRETGSPGYDLLIEMGLAPPPEVAKP